MRSMFYGFEVINIFNEIVRLRSRWNNSLRELWNLMLTHQVKWNKSTHARRHFTRRRRISRTKCISQIPQGFISLKKTLSFDKVFFWWERVDSNYWSETQQIYSLPPLATRELSQIKMELVDGLEPPTCWLQISCSTNWATPAYILCFVFVCFLTTSILYHKPFDLSSIFWKKF